MRTIAHDLENDLVSREPSARVFPNPESPGHFLVFLPDGRCTPVHSLSLETARTPAARADLVTNIISRLARTRPGNCLVTWQHAWTLFAYLLTGSFPDPKSSFSAADRALNDPGILANIEPR